MRGQSKMVLLLLSFFFLWFLSSCYTLLYHQRMFIYSKPPGRRLVLAEVHIIQTYSLANIVTSLGLGGLLASTLGPLSFSTRKVQVSLFLYI